MPLTMDEFLEKTKDGKIFSVRFIKRTNGKERHMVCRRGVKKNLTGQGLAFKPEEKDLLVVYDVQKLEEGATEKGAYRMINLSDLLELKLGGKSYEWNDRTEQFVEVKKL